jgi:DNA-binding CsgD family transcriptional regulator
MNRREEMRAMRAQGYKYREIGEAFGISKQRAYYLIKRAKSGEARGWNVYSQKQWCWIADRRKEGYTLKELADFLDTNQSWVSIHTRKKDILPPLEQRKSEFYALPDERRLDEMAGSVSVYSPAQWEWVNDRYEEGYSARKLAEFLGLKEKTIYDHCTCRQDMVRPPLERRKAEFYRLAGEYK